MAVEYPGKDLSLPEEMRDELSGSLGPVLDLDQTLMETQGKIITTIGDQVTRDMLDSGIIPKVSAIDGKTRREHRFPEISEEAFDKNAEMENPDGTIKKAIWRILQIAYASTDSWLIRVSGEEDMLSIPAILTAPVGSFVLYGIPDKGISVNPVTVENKDRCMKVLQKMEEI